jgi:GT2 family glycosyltransferase
MIQGHDMISVIIPTCDRPAEFLRAAIESVLTQTLPPAEVIVVDNGINDADPAALLEGVTVYRLPPRVGQSRARNFGAAMAKEASLAFLDDDDLWDSGFLQHCAKTLEEEKSDCVYGLVLDMHESGPSERFAPLSGGLSVERLLRKNPGMSGQNIFIRKETFWRVGGLDESLRVSDDRDLAVRLVLSGARISFCPAAKAIVRHHAGPRVTDRPPERFRLLFKYRSSVALSTKIKLGAVFSYLSARRLAGGMLRKVGLKT